MDKSLNDHLYAEGETITWEPIYDYQAIFMEAIERVRKEQPYKPRPFIISKSLWHHCKQMGLIDG
jgi:hypothetical protein